MESNPMNLNQYQLQALNTAIYPADKGLIYPAMKLGSEAGEVQGKVGKWLRGDIAMQDQAEFFDVIADELGDVLWYCAALARDIGYTLEGVAVRNLNKLSDRAARGVLKGDGDNR